MKFEISHNEFVLLQKIIEEKCGIALGNDKAYLIESRLSNILNDFRFLNFDDEKLSEKIIDAITTNETFWFREKSPWIIMESILLPKYIEEIKAGKRSTVRIWSAACSTGQEPYSISMCIDKFLKSNSINNISLKNFEIYATDISGEVLQIAKSGKYDAISIFRGLDEYYKSKYFTNQERIWELTDYIKQSVNFKKFNLQNDFSPFGKFDIIFCRYALIYFSDILKKQVLRKIASSLVDDGILFIGKSEVYFDSNEYFDIIQNNNGTYFILKR